MMPHVMHSVEELAVVRDLSNWSNYNIQFIGKLLCVSNGEYMCEGIEKNTSSSKVGVDFSLTAQIPPRNVVVRIWGELELKNLETAVPIPIVKAKIARVISSIDIPLYRKSLEIRREYTHTTIPPRHKQKKKSVQ